MYHDSGAGQPTITTVATSDGYFAGPMADLPAGRVYYARLDGDTWQLCAYDWSDGTTDIIYAAPTATFPGPSARPAAFNMAFDTTTKTAVWFADTHLEAGKVMALDTTDASPTPSVLLNIDETAELGGTTVMTDWLDLEVDCEGNVYLAFCRFNRPVRCASLCSGLTWREQTKNWCGLLLVTASTATSSRDLLSRARADALVLRTIVRFTAWSLTMRPSGCTTAT